MNVQNNNFLVTLPLIIMLKFSINFTTIFVPYFLKDYRLFLKKPVKSPKRKNMSDFRIKQHPILPIPQAESIEFYWQDQKLTAHAGETIAAALFANGIRVFGHHHKDQSPQGIFCANGQCAQCMVLANGQPVKSCMEKIKADARVFPANGLPELPLISQTPVMKEIEKRDTPVLIIGGGPAGLSAAIELGKLGVKGSLN